MRQKLAIKCLILFLLLSQIMTIAHAIEHQFVFNEDGQCLICNHANDNINAIVNTQLSTQPDVSGFEKLAFKYANHDLKVPAFQNIRSPPIRPNNT